MRWQTALTTYLRQVETVSFGCQLKILDASQEGCPLSVLSKADHGIEDMT